MGTHSLTQRHAKGVEDFTGVEGQMAYARVPRLVQWMATLGCGLKCRHCLAADENERPGDMPLGQAFDLIDQVAEMGVPEFLITGGEPLLRSDLPAVIERLASRNVSVSINTAVEPNRDLKRVFEVCPPRFVAVSLDGPREIHDAFRGRVGSFEEALRSISFFSSLPGCEVAAGTTVTTANFAALPQTFHLAATSGAKSWGVHLLIPEGRAALRPELFLSREQLKWLMKFVVSKRRYFSVNMADEFGYCGAFEPLLRDYPFSCGAGKVQCVVLPDGEVVPCTTLDSSTSSGNIAQRALEDIWREGFQELRQWQASGRCGGCQYAEACRGGCWLQRRREMECYKELWHMPEALRTAAGAAICFGVAALAGCEDSPEALPGAAARPNGAVEKVEAPEEPAQAGREQNETPGAGSRISLDQCILAWYGRQLDLSAEDMHPHVSSENEMPNPAVYCIEEALRGDSAYRFFERMRANSMPEDLQELTALIEASLQTEQRSLAFIGLLWRSLIEWTLKSPGPEKRSPHEQMLLRQALFGLAETASTWRQEILKERISPFLMRDMPGLGQPELCCMSKAVLPNCACGNPRGLFNTQTALPKWRKLLEDTIAERWTAGRTWYDPRTNLSPGARVDWESYSKMMDSAVPRVPRMSLLVQRDVIYEDESRTRVLSDTLGESPQFLRAESDQIKPQDSSSDSISYLGDTRITYRHSTFVGAFDLLTVSEEGTQRVELHGRGSYPLELPLGVEISFGDLLKLAYRQQKEELDRGLGAELGQYEKAFNWPYGRNPVTMSPVYLEAARNLLEDKGEESVEQDDASQALKDAARLWLADFWMF